MTNMYNDLFVKMVIDNWKVQVSATDKLLEKLTDEQLMREISPSRNRGIYLLGHLIAVHDLMLPLLRLEEAAFFELHAIFLDAPDRAVAGLPAIAQLRGQWKDINRKLSGHFDSITPEEWFTRHYNISEEDFKKEPHRNRLNVVISRTMHLSFHRGQLILLTPKN